MAVPVVVAWTDNLGMECPKCGRKVKFSKVDTVGQICPCVTAAGVPGGIETMKNEPKPVMETRVKDSAIKTAIENEQPFISSAGMNYGKSWHLIGDIEPMKNEPKPDIDPVLAKVLQDAQPKMLSKGGTGTDKPPQVGICGHCPKCGAPIFGPQVVNVTETQAGSMIRYTCDCRNKKTFEETIRTT